MALCDVTALLGLLLIVCASYECTKARRAAPADGNGGWYPKFPLTISQFENIIMQGRSVSKPFYEAYALQPTYFRPVLRKVAIRWRVSPLASASSIQNDYAGWYKNLSICTQGVIDFQNVSTSLVRFRFQDVYPKRANFIGTIFSSYPDRYLINWYCPEDELVQTKCRDGLRMSITSTDVPDRLPEHLIDEDLRTNNAPPRSNIRWMMTYDAPKQCPFQETKVPYKIL